MLLPTANMILRGPAGIPATLYCEIIPQSVKQANRLAAVSAASKCSPPTLSKYTSSPLGAACSKASVRGLAAAATNVDYMLALSRLQYVYGGKTQWLDLTIQWLLKLCPCFAGARIPIFELCGVRRSRRDLRHDNAGLRRLRQFIGR